LRRELFISNGWETTKQGPTISGGDVRWLEIAKEWQKLGIQIHILTQKAGKEFCEKMDLQGEIHYHYAGEQEGVVLGAMRLHSADYSIEFPDP
jgi:hypothetical protein